MIPRCLADIPGPHRRYSAKHPHNRRRVVVRIGAFTGHALHFHVTMREGRERMMKVRTYE